MKPLAIGLRLAALLAAASCAPATGGSFTMSGIEANTSYRIASLPIHTQYGHDPVYPNYGGR